MRRLLSGTLLATLCATGPAAFAQTTGSAPIGTAVPAGTSVPGGTAGQPGTSGQPGTIGQPNTTALPGTTGTTALPGTTGQPGSAGQNNTDAAQLQPVRRTPVGGAAGTDARGTLEPGRPQPVESLGALTLSVDQAVDYALRHNASIKNARIDVALQKQKNREITGIALPQISGRNEFTHYPNPIVAFFPAQLGNPNAPEGEFITVPVSANFANTANISASQILFDGSVLVALQARNTIIQLTELGVEASAQDVRYNVRRAYYGLVIANRQYSTLTASLATFRDVLRDLTILRQQGFVERIEVDRTQVQVNNLATDSLRTANLITLSEQLLKFNMSLPITQPIVLTDTAINDVLDQTSGLLSTETDYNKRVDYSLLLTQLRLNEFDAKRYRYKALPTLAAFGNVAYTYANNSFREVATPHNYVYYSLVGLRLDVPIFSGFTRKAQLEQAILNVEKTRNNIQQLRLGIDLQNEQARTTLRNALLSLQSNERNLTLANSVLDLARKKYKAGVGSNLEVTQAQTEVLQSQNRLFASQLDVINATTDVQRAQGLFR